MIIGGGAFGRVWEVEHKETKQRYAMKEIPHTIYQGDKEIVIDWEKEARAMQKINCKNDVRIVDWFSNKICGYIVMELCKGGTLGAEIKKRKTSGRMFSENVSL